MTCVADVHRVRERVRCLRMPRPSYKACHVCDCRTPTLRLLTVRYSILDEARQVSDENRASYSGPCGEPHSYRLPSIHGALYKWILRDFVFVTEPLIPVRPICKWC